MFTFFLKLILPFSMSFFLEFGDIFQTNTQVKRLNVTNQLSSVVRDFIHSNNDVCKIQTFRQYKHKR